MLKKGAVKLLILFLVINFFGFQTQTAKAASAQLLLTPASGSYTVNKSFTLNVVVDSGGGTGINAAEGIIKFDPSFLSVSKISDSGTIFKLWVTDPTYSNQAGTVNFGGGLYTAYKGNNGQIFSITMTPKKAGDTKVEWTSGSVLAADGIGTNVLGGYGAANISISEAITEEPKETTKPKPEETKSSGIVPPMPDIDSSSHPDENTWYANSTPEFIWKLLADLTGVSMDLNEKQVADPGSSSDGIVDTKKYENTPDGEWYFHVKYQNKSGWGPIKNRKVLIDTTIPKIGNVKINNGGDDTNPTPLLEADIKDETSGIKEYKLLLDNDKLTLSPKDFQNNSYRFSVIPPGEHNLSISAIDMAGNSASTSLRFFIEPLKAPIITDIPEVIKRNDELGIRGVSFYSNVDIILFIGQKGKDPDEFTTKTDSEGNWTYFHKEKLDENVYEISAMVVDERGAQSFKSSSHILNIVSPSLLEAFGWYIIILLLLIITALVLFIIYREKKFYEERLRIMRETKEAKLKLTEIFHALREETSDLIELADKKPGLSESERRVKEKIQEALEISEEFIGKELEDINKEINLKKEE